jgi:hypothetical protein
MPSVREMMDLIEACDLEVWASTHLPNPSHPSRAGHCEGRVAPFLPEISGRQG